MEGGSPDSSGSAAVDGRHHDGDAFVLIAVLVQHSDGETCVAVHRIKHLMTRLHRLAVHFRDDAARHDARSAQQR